MNTIGIVEREKRFLQVAGTTGDIQIDGHVTGNIRGLRVMLEPNAVVDGQIVADEVILRGRFQGEIRARKIRLCKTCHLEGTLSHESLEVEFGASFEGKSQPGSKLLVDGTGSGAA